MDRRKPHRTSKPHRLRHLLLASAFALSIGQAAAAAPGHLYPGGADRVQPDPAVSRTHVLVIAMNSTDAVDILRRAGFNNITAATTPSELADAWHHLDRYDLVTWSYHEFSYSYASGDFLAAHHDDLLRYVKGGGHLLGVTRDDPADNDAVLSAFRLRYDGAGTQASPGFAQVDTASPIFAMPNRIDNQALRAEGAAVGDGGFVGNGLVSHNPQLHAVAMSPGGAPAVLAGRLGQGKVIFTAAEVTNPIFATPMVLKLLQNMIDWLVS
ncbi:MAG TPA: hypothetical protein VFK80_02105 [Limnochordia bacterium]|nr:hypothetical protein [Limnochordia bacterium]